jgi:hypothetical protein
MKAIKGFQKNGTIRVIKHVFVWHIVYEQRVANVSVKINKKKDIKVFVKNWLIRLI